MYLWGGVKTYQCLLISFLSLSLDLFYSLLNTHVHVIHMTCMSMSVLFTLEASVCQCVMNFDFSFLKESLYADTSVIECLLSLRLK